MLGRNILIQFAIFQKSGLLAEIGHFEVFSGIFGVTDLTLGHPRVAPEGFFLLYYSYPVPKLLAEAFLSLGPDLVHLNPPVNLQYFDSSLYRHSETIFHAKCGQWTKSSNVKFYQI